MAYCVCKISGETPDWVENCYEYEKNFFGGMLSVLKDPTLLVEGIAQGASDAYEEKGIFYCVGYGIGEVAQIVVLKKISEKVKGISKADDLGNSIEGG